MAREQSTKGSMVSFRMTTGEQERLRAFAGAIGLTQTDAVRFGLIALKTLVDEGYEFRPGLAGDRPTIFKRSPQGRTIKFFDVSDDGALIDQGRMAQWTGAPEDE